MTGGCLVVAILVACAVSVLFGVASGLVEVTHPTYRWSTMVTTSLIAVAMAIYEYFRTGEVVLGYLELMTISGVVGEMVVHRCRRRLP